MKLSQWAKKQGICYLTAYRWFKAGKISGTQYDTGTIIIDDGPAIPELKSDNIKECVIYCRVSNQSRKAEMEYQVKRCEDFCIANGYKILKVYKEVASGMNDKRRELLKMLDQNYPIIVVENKDRLTRFGFNYLQILLEKLNTQIIVINSSTEDEEDLMKDLVSIITSFCCRLYGLRRTKNKVNKIKKILESK